MVRVTARVRPGASSDQLVLADDGSLDVRLRARAVEGKANEALISLLAKALGLRRREVVLVRGARARVKLLEVPVASMEELGARLRRSTADA